MILIVDTEKAYQSLEFLLKKKAPAEISRYAHTTYTFFKTDDIIYSLIKHKGRIPQLGIMSAEHQDVINLESLLNNETLKSQLMWDLLEQGGVRYYSFNLLYKGTIPDQSQLEDIDFSSIR